jgi:ipoprotein LpqH
VDSRLIAGVAVVVAVGGLVGCSDPEPVAPAPGSLRAGTAEVNLDGTEAGTTNAVSCSSTGTLTTINTGDENAGTTSSIDSAEGLSVQFAQITNLGGFTGSYWADLGPSAKVEMTGQTYVMTGSATGFDTDKPSFRATRTFSIKVAC